jgi:hypothetical protein
VQAVRIEADHNYNRESREAMYAWLARWMKGAPADVKVPERGFTADSPADLLVFYQRPLPPEAIAAEQLTENWIAAARRQLPGTDLQVRAALLRHALGFGDRKAPAPAASRSPVVLLTADDAELEGALKSARFTVKQVAFKTFDAGAAAKVRHFETYNRTQAAQRVADVVAALDANPGAAIVANGDAALAALLAASVATPRLAVLDVGAFDTSNDTGFADRLYVPGLRRAGDLATAAAVAGDRVVIHGASATFALEGISALQTRMTAKEIVARLRRR